MHQYLHPACVQCGEIYWRGDTKHTESKPSAYKISEVIFVDDGSTDQTVERIVSFRSRFNFTLVHCADGPSGAAGRPRNIGMQIASGDYIVFMDPDDLLMPQGLEQLYQAMMTANSDVVSGRYYLLRERTAYDLFQQWPESMPETITNFKVEQFPFCLNIPNNLCAKIFKRSFLRNSNP